QECDGGVGDDVVVHWGVELFGYEAVADPLDAVRSPGAAREQRALVGLDGVEAHGVIALPQIAAHAGKGAAAALRGDERADDAAGLLPDLGPGRAVVRLDVVGVVELARHPVPGRVAGADLRKALERQVHVALAAGREDEIGAVRAHDLLALVAHTLGHHHRAGITLHRRHECARDAGVAGRALEHAHARLEITAGLGLLEHVQIDPVLEAAARSVPLELEVDERTHIADDAVEPYERRAPDGLDDARQRGAMRVPADRHEDRIVPDAW